MKKWNIKAKAIVRFEEKIIADSKNDAIKQFEKIVYENLKNKNIPYQRGDIIIDEKGISISDE